MYVPGISAENSVKRIIRILVFCLFFTLVESVAYSQSAQPNENPSITVTGKVPPPYRDPYTYFQPDSLLDGTISGLRYHNDFFGFSYDIPHGFSAEDTDVTKRRDKGEAVRAEPRGDPCGHVTRSVLACAVTGAVFFSSLALSNRSEVNSSRARPSFISAPADGDGPLATS